MCHTILEEGTKGYQNPCDPSLDIRAATGEEAGAGEYWNTSVHADRSLPEAEYIKDAKDYTIKETLGNGNPNEYADIDANITPNLSEFKGNYNAYYDYAGTDTSQQAMDDYLESHGIKINGPYTCLTKKNRNIIRQSPKYG